MSPTDALEFVLKFDQHLKDFIVQRGGEAYFWLGGIIFAETGLVVFPFLPGDSLLFATGALCALGLLRWEILLAILFLAAFCGDNVNYFVGRTIGPRVLRGETGRWLNRNNLDRTHLFFERHGGRAVVMARFVPIVRTFAPFVAGVGQMSYAKFASYSLLGTALWAAVCITAGYLFGNIPAVQKHFTLVILGIIVVSLIPLGLEYLKARRSGDGAASGAIARPTAGAERDAA